MNRLRLPRAGPYLSGVLAVLRWLALGVSLGVALGLVLQSDRRDALREIDRLLLTGRYHEALTALRPPVSDLAEAQLRLGIVQALRGEAAAAERHLREAMLRGLAPADYQRALLYLGRTLADDGRGGLATRTWTLAEDCRSAEACVYRAPARILAAEEALRNGAYAAAEGQLRKALTGPISSDWADVARYRLALLAAGHDPAAARRALVTPTASPVIADPLIAPLLPPIGDGPQRLSAALALSPSERPQALGMLYLSLGLYGLAETQFTRVDPNGPGALGAAAYAGYTRWRAGDVNGGLERLKALVAAHPQEPRARTLLALAYLSADASEAARNELDLVTRLRPNDPEVALAWASWHVARREYDLAAQAYHRAISQAPEAERGRYALLGAKFHLTTTYALCESGLPLAELAARTGQHGPDALTTLAACRYHCGQFAEAAAAAREAQQAGGGPEAAYYLGAALAALGDTEHARSALIRAADLSPASLWRHRAELALARLSSGVERPDR